MSKEALFIVIEGLDGSGKTTVARQLTNCLEAIFGRAVKLTFEPHDASCGGLYIRQVLTKKIKQFSHKTLALAFAANRLDHGHRHVSPWLDQSDGQILICDRYYLSSLVYQSNDDFSMEQVMELNNQARRPDIIFFMNVSNEVCFSRMEIRNQPQELFEVNLSETRNKYLKAIQFLQKYTEANIIEIDGNGTIEQSLLQLTKAIYHHGKKWQKEGLLDIKVLQSKMHQPGDYNAPDLLTINQLLKQTQQTKPISKASLLETFQTLSPQQIGAFFLDYFKTIGYQVGPPLTLAQSDAFELRLPIPGTLELKGTLLFLPAAQQLDKILAHASHFPDFSDFLFVCSPTTSEVEPNYFEQEVIQYINQSSILFPKTKIMTQLHLIEALLEFEIA